MRKPSLCGSFVAPWVMVAGCLQPAAAAAEQPPFLKAAKAVTESIQEKYWDPKRELYYSKPGGGDHEMMWGNGIMFSALVAAARHEPRVYRPLTSTFFDSMNQFWDTKAPVPGYEPAPTRGGGNDKYYDDNAWMVLTFLEAFELTRDTKYMTRAQDTLDFVLSGWDDELGGGIWWHERHMHDVKNTCINAPAAVACLRMARFRDREKNIEWARRLIAWTTENLQDEDGLFFDSKNAKTGKVDKGKLTYNTGLMLRANLEMYEVTGETDYLEAAKRIEAACDWFLSDKHDAYRDPPKWAHLQMEADLQFYRVTGDAGALERARKHGDETYRQWQASPPEKFIEQAGVARTLWLLADHETEVGQKFWEASDKLGLKRNVD